MHIAFFIISLINRKWLTMTPSVSMCSRYTFWTDLKYVNLFIHDGHGQVIKPEDLKQDTRCFKDTNNKINSFDSR